MLLKVLIFVLLPAGFLLFEASPTIDKTKHRVKCDHMITNFTNASAGFTSCVMKHTENATFCLNCVEQYSQTLFFYDKLLNGVENVSNVERPCRSRFFESNQLHIFEKMKANIEQFWTIGFCADCFDAGCDFYNQTDCPHSNHTEKIIQLHYETDMCINGTERNTTCTECAEKYKIFTDYYNDIRLKTGDKFCFAIKDMMNKTQIRWSKELGCCDHRKSSLLDFFTLSGSSIFVSVLFYISIYLYGLRSERIQCIPDDLMPQNREDDQSNGTIMNINNEEPSTSELLLESDSKIAKLISESADSSSSDDEPLPISNPNLSQI
ncbi:uncharacterized protein LOC116340287 [Contarinia nasturtii]|uniref:uncharacterized protein LOC116340287 n=1 Tax=Contarinia nasturtii TaxID=265458 RepID=UPI0012D4707A|nr:uncharacterized protein LOC116340287 [Contarinia nasturtii]